MRKVFYDTWAFVALANGEDPDHTAAANADRSLEAMGYAPATSDYVLDETLTLLHVAAGARVALDFLRILELRVAAAQLMLLEVNLTRRGKALAIFRKLAPKVPRISFTDCTSFGLMQELGIHLAFTADAHFRAAGRSVRPIFQRKGKRLVAALPEP